jgi:hypothetical protein
LTPSAKRLLQHYLVETGSDRRIVKLMRLTHSGQRSFHDRWSLLLLLSASPVDLFAVITPGLPAASGYSVPAWDKLGALSRIRSSPNNGQGRP